MSYCVNCGVELADTEKVCPLCGVEVQNPKAPWREPDEWLYPPAQNEAAHYYHDLVAPIALLMLIPALLTLVCNLMINGRMSWSVYVIAAVGLGYVFVLLPLALTRPHPSLCILADVIATGIFLYILEYMTSGSWFKPLALPATVIAGVLILAETELFLRVKPFKLVRTAIVLATAGVFAIVLELLVNNCLLGSTHLTWSPYVLIPCVIIALAALVVERNRRLKEAVKRRFFF